MQPRTERTDWRSGQLDALITAHRDPRIILCELSEARREAANLERKAGKLMEDLSDADSIRLTTLEEIITELDTEWMKVFRDRMGVAWSYAEQVLC